MFYELSIVLTKSCVALAIPTEQSDFAFATQTRVWRVRAKGAINTRRFSGLILKLTDQTLLAFG